jgi:DNA-binding NarL/FixJ family response regulator
MSRIPVAVGVGIPAYRDGLLAAFEAAGYPSEAPDTLDTWAAQEGRRGLVLKVDDIQGCESLARLRTVRTDLVVLALLGAPTSQFYRDALRYGASAAVAWDADFDLILHVFKAAVDAMCMIPLAVMQSLVGGRPESGTTAFEERWLGMLATGRSVADVAHEAGFPERDMLHILHQLYGRLDVASDEPTG